MPRKKDKYATFTCWNCSEKHLFVMRKAWASQAEAKKVWKFHNPRRDPVGKIYLWAAECPELENGKVVVSEPENSN